MIEKYVHVPLTNVLETDNQNLWLTNGRFTTISSQFSVILQNSQNWDSDGHFEVQNGSIS